MLCQECEERQATLHFTKIVNGEKTEFHICEVCAKEKGDVIPGSQHSFSIHNLLSGLLNVEPTANSKATNGSSTVEGCPNCGLTYGQFSRSGRFGCAKCYTVFGRRLEPLFRKVHSGNVEHHGKVPRRTGNQVRKKRKIEELRRELQQAIAQEAFEEAAKLRDQIRELENE